MSADEIIAELPNLQPDELEAVSKKACELIREQIFKDMEVPESKPPSNPRWEAFLEWVESQPDDNLPADLAENFDRYQNFTLKR
jgi:hypothetical protein